MRAKEERRTKPRAQLAMPLYADYAGRCGRVRDLSLEGAFLEDHECLPASSKVTLDLWLSEYETIETQATVRRANKGHGIAVKFLGLKESQSERLRRYLRANKAA